MRSSHCPPFGRSLLPLALFVLASTVHPVLRAQAPAPSNALEKALSGITPAGLREDLTWLASDARKGRMTPSKELNDAAEWLRAKVKKAGLDPAFGESYFQAAKRDRLKGTHNVGALIRGSDEKLRDDLILFTAHYDHVGMSRRRRSGDRINNGADDNGTGSCAILAVARALASLERAPKRSVLFLWFYGEERGLLGSKRYLEDPAFPLAQHRAVFNIEMVGRPDDIPKKSAWVTGWRTSDFGEIIAKDKPAGITFYEHKRRSRMLFTRSDNIAFAKRGIPAHSISAGSLHKDYHQPSDEVDKINFENMAAVTRGLFVAGHRMADGGKLPTWKPTTSYARRHAELMGEDAPKTAPKKD